MILEIGEKLHILHLQLYKSDYRRHFVGEVEKCEGVLAKVKGYLFVLHPSTNQFVRRDNLRTRIIALDSSSLIINVLPRSVDIEKIAYDHHSANDIRVSDGSDWHLDLTHL